MTQPAKKVSAIILAAGKGTRMRSEKAKVLHEVLFAPMIHHVLDAVSEIPVSRIVVVTGHQGKQVQAALQGYRLIFAEQKQQLGTAHAVLAAEEYLLNESGTVMILCGDTPLIQAETLRRMLEMHLAGSHSLSVMTTALPDPTNYGRIISGEKNAIVGIVEEKDASPAERMIREVNAGIYCAEADFLYQALRRVDAGNRQGEFYLTDIVGIAHSSGYGINRFCCEDPGEVLGVNSRGDLAQAHAGLQQRCNRALMAAGVTILQPNSVWVEKKVVIASDTLLQPGVHLLGRTVIGSCCDIGAFSILRNCTLAAGVTIGAHSYLEGMQFSQGQLVPPHTCMGGHGKD